MIMVVNLDALDRDGPPNLVPHVALRECCNYSDVVARHGIYATFNSRFGKRRHRPYSTT